MWNSPFFRSLVAIALLCAVRAFGQGTLGSISGRLTDTSGSVLLNVSLTLTNTGTGQQKKSRSGPDGYYAFPDLMPGTYALRAELPGFRVAVTPELIVQVDQAVKHDIQMQVGELTSTVQVDAAAPLLQAETSSTGQVVTGDQILEIPLNGRNFLSLALLVPGASENPGAQSQFSINGQRGNETSMLFDGLDARLFMNGRPALTPSVDAVQEFKIQQNSFSAAYGDGTAVVNAQLRSGSNEFHGDVWEFLRNNAVDSRGFFDRAVPPLKRNQFGFTFGGPIRRNKTFFFTNYEGLRTRRSTTGYAEIPTPAQLNGDFGGSAPIYDPLNVDPGTGQRLPFANNVIPANRVSIYAKTAAQWYPKPNITGVQGYNFAKTLTNPENADQVNFRVDHQLNDHDSLFARFSRSTDHSVSDNPLPLSGEIDDINGLQALVHETHIFTPALLNEFSLGYSYGLFRLGNPLAPAPLAVQAFGLQNLNIPAVNQGMPLLNVTGYSTMGSAQFRPFGGLENHYQLSDDLSWTHGRHQIKIGGEVRQYRPALYDQSSPNGSLSFNGQFSGLAGKAGNPVADLVLGYPYTATATELIGSNGQVTLRWWHYALYFQDDFKLTPKLTLNMGLRYEYDQPFHEIYGAARVWDGRTNQFGDATSGPLTNPDRNNFAPRVGFAYSPTPLTVIRGGFGVFYGFIRGEEVSSGYHLDPPYNVTETVNSNATVPTLLPGTLFPLASTAVTPSTSLFSVDPNLPANYTYEYNLSIQRQVLRTLSLQASYVGSSSHKLIGRDLINQAHVDAAPTHPTSIQSRRPFQGAADISITKAIDNANYNALQVTAEKRTSAGLTLLAAYTWSKALGISEGGDQSAIGNEYVSRHVYYGPTPYDQPQRFTISSMYELPFGHGKAFANSLHPVLDKAVSGWQLGGIGTFFKGEFTTPTSNISANVGRVDRNVPNCAASPNLPSGQASVLRWFNTAALLPQAFGTFGNCGTGIIEIPGENNLDLSLIKDTRFRDRYNLEFRAEFFNALNHPSFGPPNVQVGSASIGVISSTRTTPREIQFALKFYW